MYKVILPQVTELELLFVKFYEISISLLRCLLMASKPFGVSTTPHDIVSSAKLVRVLSKYSHHPDH